METKPETVCEPTPEMVIEAARDESCYPAATRQLAERIVRQLPREADVDVDAWAAQLASDIANAND